LFRSDVQGDGPGPEFGLGHSWQLPKENRQEAKEFHKVSLTLTLRHWQGKEELYHLLVLVEFWPEVKI